MPEYKNKFLSALNEFDIPETNRNIDDANLTGEVDPTSFNTDPESPNVGSERDNTSRDVKTLNNTLSEIDKINDGMKKLSDTVSNLERTFEGIGKSSKTMATINQKLYDLKGELEGYIMSMPAQQIDSDKASEQPDY